MTKTACAFFLLTTAFCIFQCSTPKKMISSSQLFPQELTHFLPYNHNPVFAGTGIRTWDSRIRERGFILFEDSVYHLWYTGFEHGEEKEMHLGYATSTDGFNWSRYKGNPIFSSGWVEDVFVIKEQQTYYMFAEGKNDVAHMLTSSDRIHWTDQGNLDIRKVNGQPIDKGPYGTPTVWKENAVWYLFYERNDGGIWVASSKDLKQWTNIQDEPVINMGPEGYDKFGVAVNQVIKYKGLYYAYYHATAFEDWSEWSTCVAVSTDLIHWKKYDKNPIITNNSSSGIIVNDASGFRFYTMHPEVRLFFPTTH